MKGRHRPFTHKHVRGETDPVKIKAELDRIREEDKQEVDKLRESDES